MQIILLIFIFIRYFIFTDGLKTRVCIYVQSYMSGKKSYDARRKIVQIHSQATGRLVLIRIHEWFEWIKVLTKLQNTHLRSTVEMYYFIFNNTT